MRLVRILLTTLMIVSFSSVWAEPPIVNPWGPVPIEAGQQIAKSEKWALLAAPRVDVRQTISTDEGVWMQDIVSGVAVATEQCVVLIDALDVATGYGRTCLHRLSIVCMSAGRDALVVGLGQPDPFAVPIDVPLFQPPQFKPVASLRLSRLAPSPEAGLNTPERPWRKAASVIGENQCGATP